MRHPRTVILGSSILAVVVITGFFACNGCLGTRVQKLRSDVPVISNIGSWPYQKGLRVDDLAVTVVGAPLNHANKQALVRFQIKGRIAASNGWRPLIKEVQLSERIGGGATQPYGDLSLVPIVGVNKDATYGGEDVPFDVKIEQYIQTLNWGANRYVVVAGEKHAEFTLQQKK